MTREQQLLTGRSRKAGIAGLVTGGLLVIGSVAALVVLWITLGDRGLNADATGTAGFITQRELIAGGAAGLGLLAGAALLTIGLIGLRTHVRNNQ